MKKPLDSLLKDWAAGHRPGDDHLEKMARAITAEASRRRYASLGDEAPAVLRFPLGLRLAYSGLGVALAALFMVVFMRDAPPAPAGGESASGAALAVISNTQMESEKKLFGEMQRMFSDRLRWIVKSNGDMGVGVETLTGGTRASAPAMVVRLTVVSRSVGDKAWKPAWTTDVTLRGEEMVEVAPSRDHDNRLALWVYPLNDGRIAIDTDVALESPVKVCSSINAVVTEGTPSEIMAMRVGDTEYRVYQTVRSLGNAAGDQSA